MPEIDIIRLPRPVIDNIPPPITGGLEPPIVNGIQAPVVDVPGVTIDYPIIDVPTEQDFRDDLSQPQTVPAGQEEVDTRELPPPNPTIEVGGVEVPLPKPEVAVTAGTTAVVATTVSLFAAMAFQQVKTALAPMAKEMMRPKKGKKTKIKQKKPVLHFVENDEGVIEIFQYSEKGVKVLDRVNGKLETYLRDQIEINPYYEMENKIIVDDVLQEQFTKEGVKRFKSLFTPAKVILKKLSAKFSF